MANHYVNNADFLSAIKAYRQSVKDAEESGEAKPQVTNELGGYILKIAQHLAYKPNFINYTFRDEMVSDGIENCLMYINNFDPEKSSNPFAYFTQIIYYAFIRRIQKEKKQTLIKGKIVMEMPFDEFDVQEQDEDGTFINSYRDFMQNSGVFDEILEKEAQRKSKKKKAPTLDDILEDQ